MGLTRCYKTEGFYIYNINDWIVLIDFKRNDGLLLTDHHYYII